MTVNIESANIFVTGGAGTLGRAIARRRMQDGWTGKLTVYSRDDHKHDFIRKNFPGVNCVQGDIRNPETLYNAMVGHDIVIHAAAVKVIPVSEYYSLDTIDVNVTGSQIVCAMAIRANIQHVLGISTDKACHPANAYGASKMLMEKIFQEYARVPDCGTQFHLVRYGNVLESTGSVVEAWRKTIASGQRCKMTDPAMTRFWLSPSQAVGCALRALDFESGMTYIPIMSALPITFLYLYTIGSIQDYPVDRIPLRPGEKIHETLVTKEETFFTKKIEGAYILRSTTQERNTEHERDEIWGIRSGFSSEEARQLTEEELKVLLND
jgi:UDP-N-acetylglucosamine 4,6-dehydratase/5-epimerase